MIPSSFCCISTNKCVNETFSFLLSLSIHHKNETIYIMTDKKSKDIIEKKTPKLLLNIIWFVELDEYSDKDRNDMLKENIWTEFQMKKSLIIEKVLEFENDTLFMDTDIIILNQINDIDINKDIGLSPAYINEEDMKKVGYYNGGYIWVRNKTIPNKWIEYSKTSRYHDQAALDDLKKDYNNFKFKENHNFHSWRFKLNNEDLKKNFEIKENEIYYKENKLISIHTHFLQHGLHKDFNQFIIDLLMKSKKYKELLCIFKILNNGNWLINIPKQPRNNIFNHNNDSYRELLYLYKEDLIITQHDSGHIWLYPSILLYDRPTLEWINNEVLNSHLLLLGNGDIKDEGELLNKKGIKIKPWIFWPRNPKLYEEIFEKGYKEKRNVLSIFIGNYENPVQEKYRTNVDWKDVIEEFHITKGTQHKFTGEEYIEKLQDSKYGLCLRGYGSKCHREVECMGMGCVPIITENVCIKSYINSPVENEHYIYVEKPEELKEKINNISEDEWKIMSKNCVEWYEKNVYSKNSWKLTIENIFYDRTYEFDFLQIYDIDNKIRVGSKYDGGYIIVDNYKYDVLISCGISNDDNFEHYFVNKFNTKCYAFDGTIYRLPRQNDKIEFIKKNIGLINDKKNTNLKYLFEKYDNIFLKMDIEGSEFEWINSLSFNELTKINQICIEFHVEHECSAKIDLTTKLNAIKKISKTHYCVHLHGNNWRSTTLIGEKIINIGISETNEKKIDLDKEYPKNTLVTFDYKSLYPIKFSYYFDKNVLNIKRIDSNKGWNNEYKCVINGIQIPKVFECTYINKKLVDNLKSKKQKIPTDLDTPNTGLWKPNSDDFENNRIKGEYIPDIELYL